MRAASIRPISELKNRCADLVREVSETGETLVITQHGKAKVVVMEVHQHDRLQESLAMLRLLADSEASRARGTYTTAQVRARLRAAASRRRNG